MAICEFCGKEIKEGEEWVNVGTDVKPKLVHKRCYEAWVKTRKELKKLRERLESEVKTMLDSQLLRFALEVRKRYVSMFPKVTKEQVIAERVIREELERRGYAPEDIELTYLNWKERGLI